MYRSGKRRCTKNEVMEISDSSQGGKEVMCSTNVYDSMLLWSWATHTCNSFHNFTPEEATEIRSAILTWYRSNRRKLPWRGDPGPFDGSTAGFATKNGKGKRKTKINKDIKSFFGKTSQKETIEREPEKAISVSAYGVWVSEIMLQQTRVEAVIPYYKRWMKSFPTVENLANATEEEVNAHWAGLGFYRRARMLHSGAKYIVSEMNGEIPSDVDSLLQISGIGRYTASAISSIAFDQCVPVVDGNVCRVLSRLKGVANNIKAPIFKDKIGWTLATQIVEAGDGKNAGEVNQALMELGATYCAPSGTGVDSDDPIRDHWLSTKLGKDVGQIVISDTLSIEEFISKAAIERGGTECQLCQPNDIEGFLLKCSEDLEVKRKGLSLKDFEVGALISGHASLPIPPPKKAKREEILAMAVFSSLNEGTHEERWLMVKRPNEGLLAGQWEFPSSCVWISNKKKSSSSKEKVAPTSFDPNIRKESIDNMMSNFTFPVDQHGEVSMNKIWQEYQGRVVTPEPLEHIFSHVKHTMFVEYIDISSAQFSLRHDTYQSRDEREFRWMTKVEMKNVGITSGVKKVLIAIEKARPTQRRKRKRE